MHHASPTNDPVDLDYLRQWVGRKEIHEEMIDARRSQQLAASLDWTETCDKGTLLPAPWHWIYFQPTIAASETAHDGHKVLDGSFLPPVTLPKRMWAGSEVEYGPAKFNIGDTITKESVISDISLKNGRSGPMVFVTVEHKYIRQSELVIFDKQSIVYRGDSKQAKARTVIRDEMDANWSSTITPDTVLLFRYSALTHNSHRIHYDRAYAVGIEGYDGIVVQGPLTVTLLLQFLHEQVRGIKINKFSFRGLRPLIAGQPIELKGRCEGDEYQLWVVDHLGQRATEVRCYST